MTTQARQWNFATNVSAIRREGFVIVPTLVIAVSKLSPTSCWTRERQSAFAKTTPQSDTMRIRRHSPEIDDVGNLSALQPSQNDIKGSCAGSRVAHGPKEAAFAVHHWPRFEPKCGYCTNQARELYIRLVHNERLRRRRTEKSQGR